MTGFACYALMLQARQRYDTVVQETSEFDRVRFGEELTVTDVNMTALNEVNITARACVTRSSTAGMSTPHSSTSGHIRHPSGELASSNRFMES